MKKHQTNPIGDILQNHWPVFFKSVKAKKDKERLRNYPKTSLQVGNTQHCTGTSLAPEPDQAKGEAEVIPVQYRLSVLQHNCMGKFPGSGGGCGCMGRKEKNIQGQERCG